MRRKRRLPLRLVAPCVNAALTRPTGLAIPLRLLRGLPRGELFVVGCGRRMVREESNGEGGLEGGAMRLRSVLALASLHCLGRSSSANIQNI